MITHIFVDSTFIITYLISDLTLKSRGHNIEQAKCKLS